MLNLCKYATALAISDKIILTSCSGTPDKFFTWVRTRLRLPFTQYSIESKGSFVGLYLRRTASKCFGSGLNETMFSQLRVCMICTSFSHRLLWRSLMWLLVLNLHFFTAENWGYNKKWRNSGWFVPRYSSEIVCCHKETTPNAPDPRTEMRFQCSISEGSSILTIP